MVNGTLPYFPSIFLGQWGWPGKKSHRLGEIRGLTLTNQAHISRGLQVQVVDQRHGRLRMPFIDASKNDSMSTQMYAAIFFHGLKKYGDHLNYQTIGFCYVLKYRETPKSTTNCSGYPSFYLSKLQSYFGIQYPMFGSSWSAQKPLRPPAQTRRAAGL